MAKAIIDKDKLVALWGKGYTVPQISIMTGYKTDSIYKLAHRMGLPKRKGGHKPLLELDSEKRLWFIRNYPEMSNSTISVFLGLSEDYIGVIARQLGLKKSEAYWQGIKEYHRKRVKEFHATKKGDKEYYAYAIRPRKKGKFIKKNS